MAEGREAYEKARKRAQARTPQDPQHTTGGPDTLAAVAAVTWLCACGHSALLHDISAKKTRTGCSVMDRTGQCGCKLAVRVGAVG